MVDVIEIEHFACGHCGNEYDSEAEAEDCCPSYVDTYDSTYKCGNCKKEYDSEEEAEKCCSEEDED